MFKRFAAFSERFRFVIGAFSEQAKRFRSRRSIFGAFSGAFSKQACVLGAFSDRFRTQEAFSERSPSVSGVGGGRMREVEVGGDTAMI